MEKKVMDFDVLIEQGEDGYFVSGVVGIPGCHTQAKTLDELIKRTKEVISLCLKCHENLDFEDRFMGVQKIEV
jgi:predicted RNase H-like HicB family nuclease